MKSNDRNAHLLSAVFADHEIDAPDVTQTRLGIEAELARTPSRRSATTLAVGGAAAAVVLVATLAAVVGTDPASRHVQPGLGSGSAPGPHPAPSTAPRPGSMSPTPPVRAFPYRAGWLPPGAAFDHTNRDRGGLDLAGYSFGSVPNAKRGLSMWNETGPLPTRLRDGGTLRSTTIRGCAAAGGWSPSSRSYTVFILRPHHMVMTVVAYGFGEMTARSFAMHTARDMQYGSYSAPSKHT